MTHLPALSAIGVPTKRTPILERAAVARPARFRGPRQPRQPGDVRLAHPHDAAHPVLDEHPADLPLPPGGGGDHRRPALRAVKLIDPGKQLPASAPPGGIARAYGYRYWTISVPNLDELTAACEAAGRTVAITPREIRPGVRISMIEDPDGNWVELLEVASQA